MICGSGGLKSRLAKAAGAEPAGQMRNEKLTTFGSRDVEKVHAVVARSTVPSQNVQNIPGPDHCWKLRCRKSARRCGAKHSSKSKCTKHTRSGPLFGGSDVTSLRFASLHYTTLHYTNSTTLHYITLHYTPQHYNYNYTAKQLHSTTLNHSTLHYTPLH